VSTFSIVFLDITVFIVQRIACIVDETLKPVVTIKITAN